MWLASASYYSNEKMTVTCECNFSSDWNLSDSECLFWVNKSWPKIMTGVLNHALSLVMIKIIPPARPAKLFFEALGAELEPLLHDVLWWSWAFRDEMSECSTVDGLPLGALWSLTLALWGAMKHARSVHACLLKINTRNHSNFNHWKTTLAFYSHFFIRIITCTREWSHFAAQFAAQLKLCSKYQLCSKKN